MPTYIYGMVDKYFGCNTVKSEVTGKQCAARKPKKERRAGTLALRLAIAVGAVAILLVLHYCGEVQWVSDLAAVCRRIFCYDIFGRTAFGIT